jgi:hypothetical protein
MPGLQGQEKGFHEGQLKFSAVGGKFIGGKAMECPLCGCQDFFVKDPEDEFETFEFSVASGDVSFSAEAEDASAPEVQETTETFCSRCSWHGNFQELKKG